MSAADVVARCEAMVEDLELGAVSEWKERTGGKAIGCLPVHCPREVIVAAGFLPVGVVGSGDLEIIRGDAYFQSYICRLPRSVIELGLSGRLDCLDGMVFPSTCDVIRNLSGMWQVMFPDRYVKYLDVPQNLGERLGGRFWQGELRTLAADLERLGGARVDDDALRAAIAVCDGSRRVVNRLFERRAEAPDRIPTWELYLVMRAGLLMGVEEHTAMVHEYLRGIEDRAPRTRDNPRVVVSGAFCEQPPLGLIRTLERAGCWIVDDDFHQARRWLREPIAPAPDEDPWVALARAFLRSSVQAAVRYHPDGEAKGTDLVRSVRRTGAEGVVFCSPSFCDPSLLDRPMLAAALDREGIPWTGFKYAENTGQFQGIREQAGTFADSIRLWSHA